MSPEETPTPGAEDFQPVVDPGNDLEPLTEDNDRRVPDRSGWPFEDRVMLTVPAKLRGQMATQLLDAAKHLGYPAGAVKSVSHGFRIPAAIHEYLYPADNEE